MDGGSSEGEHWGSSSFTSELIPQIIRSRVLKRLLHACSQRHCSHQSTGGSHLKFVDRWTDPNKIFSLYHIIIKHLQKVGRVGHAVFCVNLEGMMLSEMHPSPELWFSYVGNWCPLNSNSPFFCLPSTGSNPSTPWGLAAPGTCSGDGCWWWVTNSVNALDTTELYT